MAPELPPAAVPTLQLLTIIILIRILSLFVSTLSVLILNDLSVAGVKGLFLTPPSYIDGDGSQIYLPHNLLCIFDHESDFIKAMTYRDARLSFENSCTLESP